ncbi:hypothetical protein M514_21016 [Trichuris suis]|uniref:DUF4371 domain-containing protein n=1 Tax=Trichuris suis TaxID=68888 RepID=A0A085NBM6_9BILA|nr:hypothetical protein M514_21016 [Trichuris suis]
MIAKSGKPHSIGEDLILPATAEILETVLHQPAPTIVSKIALSRRTVQRRIDAMAQHTEATLCGILRNTEFTLQLDESTLPGNDAVLLAYVRFIKQERLVQEFLFAKELLTDTNGESIIFEVVNDCFKEKQIPFKNILAVATDGAPSMVGRYRDFVAYLKEVLPDVLAMHCVLHRQRLVAKCLSARLNSSLQYVIQAVNRIKANALSDRLFRQLCDENEKFNRPLLHTEVRWLSKGTCLTRFYELFGSIIQFFEEHDRSLCENLQMLQGDFLRQFHDMLSLVIPNSVLDPSIVDPLNVDIYLQEELIDLQSNEEVKLRMARGYEYFWLHQEIPLRYPALWAAMKSAVTDFVTKKRNRLEVVNRGDLRLRVTSMQPNIERIVGLYASCSSE